MWYCVRILLFLERDWRATLFSIVLIYLLAYCKLKSFVENRINSILMTTINFDRIVYEGVGAEYMLHRHTAADLI